MFLEKKSFDLKLEGKSDELQRLELELAALKLEKLQSEAKRLEWEERFKEKEQELQDIQNNITRTSREVSNSSFFRKFFKRSQRSSKQDKATNTEEADYFTPRYGRSTLGTRSLYVHKRNILQENEADWVSLRKTFCFRKNNIKGINGVY